MLEAYNDILWRDEKPVGKQAGWRLFILTWSQSEKVTNIWTWLDLGEKVKTKFMIVSAGCFSLTSREISVQQSARCKMNYHGVPCCFRASIRASRVIAAKVRVWVVPWALGLIASLAITSLLGASSILTKSYWPRRAYWSMDFDSHILYFFIDFPDYFRVFLDGFPSVVSESGKHKIDGHLHLLSTGFSTLLCRSVYCLSIWQCSSFPVWASSDRLMTY